MSHPQLSAAEATRRSTSFDGLLAGDGRLLWLEEGGEHTGLMSWSPAGGVTRLDARPGNSLHAYGGGAFCVAGADVWYVEDSTGQIMREGRPSVLCAEAAVVGDLSAFGSNLLAVRERADGDDLLVIDTGSGATRTVWTGPFLSSPRWHNGVLAWLEWNDDAMPWDSTRLWVSRVGSDGRVTDRLLVAGGDETSVVEPCWSPEGVLHFFSDQSGWWNLYRWSPHAGVESVAPLEADCAAAPWEHGYTSCAFLPDGRIALIAQRGPRHQLVLADTSGTVTPVGVPLTMIKPYLAAWQGRVALIGSSPQAAQKVMLVDPANAKPPVVVRSGAPDPDPRTLSLPEQMTCKHEGVEIGVTFYPASDAAGTIVRAHSGPTYQSELRLDWETQFFTSNGFAVADVDYRGSTGFGRAFRKALDGQWGVRDVEDCWAVAHQLVAMGKAHPDRLIIYGASAGGYTALKAVANASTPFAGAVVRSAVIDPAHWQHSAPRFQRPHATILTSADRQVDPNEVCRPVAFVHGSSDPVAPMADAVALVHRLQDSPVGARMLQLAGVGHFPSGTSLTAALEFELTACLDIIRSSRLRM